VEHRLGGKQAPPEFIRLAHVVGWYGCGSDTEVVDTCETDNEAFRELGGTAAAAAQFVGDECSMK